MSRSKRYIIRTKVKEPPTEQLPTVVVLSDIALAKMIVQAVSDIPGIAGMSSGPFGVKATYGPGERVNGVVLHHLESGRLMVEVHVVVSEKVLREDLPMISAADILPSTVETPRLLRLAEQVRSVVSQKMAEVGLLAGAVIDVNIDTLQ